MRTLDCVRALFPAGTVVEVIEHTGRPDLRGQLRRVTRTQLNALEVDILSGPNAGRAGYYMVLPERARDVLELTDTQVRFRFGDRQEIVTFRVVGEQPTDHEAQEDGSTERDR